MRKVNFIILLVMIFSGNEIKSQVISPDSLVLYLPFNGNANDVSGNNHNGVVTGATLTTDRYNNPGKAYYFDGASSIVIPNITALDGRLTEFSILITVRPEQLDTVTGNITGHNSGLYTFFSWERAETDSLAAFRFGKLKAYFCSPINYGTWKSFVNYVGTWCTPYLSTASGFGKDTSVVISKWQTIAFVYKSGTMKVYRNCELVNNWVDVYPIFSELCGTDPMQVILGHVPRTAWPEGFRSFKGKIDELRIYKRALSGNEINIYADGLCEPVITPALRIIEDPCEPGKFTFTDITDYHGAVIQRRVWRIGSSDTSALATFTRSFNQPGPVAVRLELHIDSSTVLYKDTTILVSSLTPQHFLQTTRTELTLCENSNFVVYVTGAVSYNWTPCIYLSSCDIGNPLLQKPVSTVYKVYGTNDRGCQDSISIKVTVVKDDVKVFVPNAFSPNNDGINDKFGVWSTAPLNKYNLAIYNRWGQQVFLTQDQQYKWDAKAVKGDGPLGTYTWTLQYQTINGCPITNERGVVTIIR